jgi:hypothetical protein
MFRDLSATLHLGLSPEAKLDDSSVVWLMLAAPDAKVISSALVVEYIDRTKKHGERFRALTDIERATVVIDEPSIVLRGLSGDPVSHSAPNGSSFTLQDLLDAIAETARQTRSNTEWFGGIDVHHVFAESVEQQKDGTWTVFWGS